MAPDLTKQEAAVYDRQLRVWGVEVQKRLTAARILVVGCTSGVAAEVAKNIVLAGVGSLTLVDDTPSSAGAPYNFLVPADADPAQSVAEASAATLREMNPLVRVGARPGLGLGPNREPDAALLDSVDVAVLTGESAVPAMAWDAACRSAGVAFYAAATHGSASHFFADLREHTFTPTDQESIERLGAGAEASASFPPLEAALFRSWKGLHPRRTHWLFFVLRICADFERAHGRPPAMPDLPALAELGAALAREHGMAASIIDGALLQEYVALADQELPPVNAVVGGVLANEVLKAVSRRGEPVNNFFFFCLTNGAGTRRLAACGARLCKLMRPFSAQPEPEQAPGDEVTVKVNDYKAHNLEPPGTEVATSKAELHAFFKNMYRMRRVEITADLLYKQKLARGFLHLADGQEAVPAGMEAALTFQDSIIQSYRDHLTFIGRGGTPQELFAELLGKKEGAAKGLGGSMHLYKREHNFFGGIGIVGEQVPLGAGLGFKHKYKNDGHVAVAIYGDGCQNQGQLFEAFNMAALWSLPVIFVCENNHFGMGTADSRASKSIQYYTRGDYIPGLWVDGMDVLAVKNATAFAKDFALKNGPIVLEMDTYRYHGHSISDPGSTYRTRDEIAGVRRARDPIEHVRTLLLEHNFAEAKELKQIERDVKKEIDEALEAAKKGSEPPIEDLWNNIYVAGLGARLRPIEIGRPPIVLPA
ncbi:hypothetical protein WJX81_000917 [Elliptochloris bilobata]|uniref:pyruvate dehydrogenase (acetyl-transferring) n=1 Tax=Elliptochloris bilobata TaxID=381761 RepID=A0AAW1QUL7_9CHLO